MSSFGTAAVAVDLSHADQDLGPLAWVLDELRKSLDAASKALRRFVHDGAAAQESDLGALDATPLRLARQHLHQAGGALEMVGMPQAALFIKAMETCAQRYVQRPDLCSEEAAATLERASFALVDYLESVLAGKAGSAVELFPQYREVQALCGMDKVHPADLWPVERRLREPENVQGVTPLTYGAVARARLDQAVLGIVKSADAAAAHALSATALGLAGGVEDQNQRIFWKVCGGFFEAFAHGLIKPDLYAKRVASRVLLQYAGLAKGGQIVRGDRLLHDLLFYCAQARTDGQSMPPALQAVYDAFGLGRHAKVDYEARRYGRYDPANLLQARKRIAAATDIWSSLAGGDRNKLKPAADQFSLVCDSLRKLHPDSGVLADALARVTQMTATSGEIPSPGLAMEVATAVLYLQAAFEELDTPDALLTERAERLAHRLNAALGGAEPEPLEPWMEELYRRVSDQQTMGSVVAELRTTLGEAERSMDQFFRQPDDVSLLSGVPGQLSQMRGVLSVLGLDQASLAVVRMRDMVERLLIQDIQSEPERQTLYEKLGNSLGALGFLIDMLSYQRSLARKLFVYDEELGELRSLMGRGKQHVRTREGDDAQKVEQVVHARAPVDETVPRAAVELQPATVQKPVAPSAAGAAGTAAQIPSLPVASGAPSEPVSQDLPGAGASVQTAAPAPAPAPAPAAPVPLVEPEAPVATTSVSPAPAVSSIQATPVTPVTPVDAQDDGDDLLDIFLEEAREVVTNGLESVRTLEQDPGDLSEQTALRRAFHTLKGSSRMVGLNVFGEAAWSLEQMLNAWLAEQKPIPAPLLAVAKEAMEAFGRWAGDIAAKADGHWESEPFRRMADAMRLQGVRLTLQAAIADAAAAQPPAEEKKVPDAAAVSGAEPGNMAVAAAVQPESAEAMPEAPMAQEEQATTAVEAIPSAGETLETATDQADLLPLSETSAQLPTLEAEGQATAVVVPVDEPVPSEGANAQDDGLTLDFPIDFPELTTTPAPDAEAPASSAAETEEVDFSAFMAALDAQVAEAAPTQEASALAEHAQPELESESAQEHTEAWSDPSAWTLDLAPETDSLQMEAPAVEADQPLSEDVQVPVPAVVDETLQTLLVEADAPLAESPMVEEEAAEPVVAPVSEPTSQAEDLLDLYAATPAPWSLPSETSAAEAVDTPASEVPGVTQEVPESVEGFASLLDFSLELPAGGDMPAAADAPVEEVRPVVTEAPALEVPVAELSIQEPGEEVVEEALAATLSAQPAEPDAESAVPPLEAADGPAAPEVPPAENVPKAEEEGIKHIGHLRIGALLYSVYLNEADEWSMRLERALEAWEKDPQPADLVEPTAWAHSLAGSSATVGFQELSDLSRLLEHALEHAQLMRAYDIEHVNALVAGAREIRRLLHQFAAGFLKTAQAQVVRGLDDVLNADVLSTGSPAFDEALTASPQRLGEQASTPLALMDPADKMDQSVEDAIARVVALDTDIDDDLDEIDHIDPDLFPFFEEEASELFPNLAAVLRQWAAHPQQGNHRDAVLRGLHTLKGSARLAGAMRLGEMAHRLESSVEETNPEAGIEPSAIEKLVGSFDILYANFEALKAISQQEPSEPHDVRAQAEGVIPVVAAPEQTAAPELPDVPLPTKASGATKPAVSAPAAPRPQASSASRSGAQQSVRVRSQLLDRLVNQAGEVMISRSRLEVRMEQMKSSMADLSSNLEKLRLQLRDIEVQSESQMQSRLALSKDAESTFDPLEFDRFTRVQELTRMMAESVNDLATVQRNLQRALDGAEDDLVAQARQTRELQKDLLRTRMIEFEAISERLYAVVRQASKEEGKQIKLDISGGSIELDRGVLDRMTPAFEHLLRNCVVHGIEAPERRQERGKVPVGTIAIALHQEGNDVSVEFSDDGAGLDLERIRAKAVQQGLIQADDVVDEAQAANLIFMPGFTTATQVTGLAGRGVGMDVVMSEIKALGGRVETSTRPGHGTTFRLVLPLTTAVTQVVMLRAGDRSIGIPANLVEIVRRVTLQELEHAYAQGAYSFDGEQVPFYWSGALLQSSTHSEEVTGRTRPVVIVRSASQRVALHVDEVLGNQEVVVKNLGPQLSRLPGLAGMSVLPSGAVVLIYNPVALSTVYGNQAREQMTLWRSSQTAAADAATGMAEAPGQLQPPVLAATALPAVSEVPLVLVVDDSITVRRVTQRLLQREGYRVSLAADGLQALERLQEERPAVVLSDIEMPRMDGFDLARNIRGDARLADLPIIMITSRIAQKHREHAMELGVNHYLGKPYSDEELLGLIQHYTRTQTPS